MQIQKKMPRKDFFDKYAEWAILTQARSGVPSSITLAQAALESGYGESRLARIANNLFGIKHHGWYGEYVLADDDAPNEKFRKYNTVYDSFIDHADFLRDNKRYNSCFDNTDYSNWARCLKQAGYATDPQYAEKLINIIEQYGLDRYDEQGNEQMGEFTNTVIRNRKQIIIIGSVVLVLLIVLWIAFKKILQTTK